MIVEGFAVVGMVEDMVSNRRCCCHGNCWHSYHPLQDMVVALELVIRGIVVMVTVGIVTHCKGYGS